MKLYRVKSVNNCLCAAPLMHHNTRDAMAVWSRIAMLAVLQLLSTPVRADDPTYVLGRGTQTSCGQFIAAMVAHRVAQQADGVPAPRASERALITEYIQGLLTGINLSRERAHQIKEDNATVEAWLQNWCANHASNNLLDAVKAFAAATEG
ncbi:MAG TPA: hypothetical protein VGI23_23865 [Steroidobacteraceae bacterium]